MSEKEILSKLYFSWRGVRPTLIFKLDGAGSSRRYYRLQAPGMMPAIGVGGDDLKENETFVRLAASLGAAGINVPDVYGVSKCGKCYLQQDLGSVSLFDIIMKEGEESPRVRRLIEESLDSLARLQTLPVSVYENELGFPPFSMRQIMWDLNYFKYAYLKPAGVDFNEDALEDDFELFARQLWGMSQTLGGFMYRDCQSRNVMVKDEVPYWIDFQGGRLGPAVYDAVSFLWQARAGFSAEFRKGMMTRYWNKFYSIKGENIPSEEHLDSIVANFVFFRTLQVLGAYGFRGLVEKKAHFIESIPGGLANLSEVLKSDNIEIGGELRRVCMELCNDRRFKPRKKGGLRIQVFSFSYKKGYPADYSGNGGGFMFDCRGMHNPGRYDEYKPLTGLDAPVREFLEERGEVQKFTDNVMSLVSPSVETYLRRGFDSLQVGFGCTGGRHRSVYCADVVSQLLADRYPDAIIEVCHREQGISRIYNEKM